MNLVLIGGHSRNIGKTSVMVGIINALAELNWIAVKITQTGHNICADDGTDCGCEVPAHEFILAQETEISSRADTTRFLAAGAKRSLWLRTRQGELVTALQSLKSELEAAPYVIIESNSLRKFWTPKLYLQVLDPTVNDFKLSAQQFFDLADAYIIVDKGEQTVRSKGDISKEVSDFIVLGKKLNKPYFVVKSSEKFVSDALIDFIRQSLL